MSVQEQPNRLTQTIEAARAELRTKHQWSAEFSQNEAGELVRAIIASAPGVTNPGNVTMAITGGEQGLDRVSANVVIVGLEGKKLIKKFRVNRATVELRNKSATMQPGQERLQTGNISADPQSILGQDVAGMLAGEIGDEKVNTKIATGVFGKRLNSGPTPVVIKTYGVSLTENNTLRVSLTA